MRPQVLWGVTRDFTQDTYEYGGVFIDTGGDSIDTTMIQRPLPDGGRRTYRITKDNAFGNGIWMDSTDAPRWWEPGTPWTTVQTRIGAEYAVGGDPGGVEGPAAFASHSADEWYLFVDVIPEIGYRPLVTDDLDAGWRPLQAEDYHQIGVLTPVPPLAAHQAWRRDRPDPRRLRAGQGSVDAVSIRSLGPTRCGAVGCARQATAGNNAMRRNHPGEG